MTELVTDLALLQELALFNFLLVVSSALSDFGECVDQGTEKNE